MRRERPKIQTDNPLQDMIYVLENVAVVAHAGRELKRPFYKIGWVQAENNIHNRIGDLQIGNPFPLTLYCATPGVQHQEEDLHTLLHVFSARGEWYPNDDAVMRVIEALKVHGIHAGVEQAQRELHAYKGTKRNTRTDCWLRFVSRYESRKTGIPVTKIRRRYKRGSSLV